MDTKDQVNRANIARHIAALANHGGGYLVFGIDDRTLAPMGETALDRKNFSQDEIVGIAKKYLEPCPAIRMDEAEHCGVRYPVVIVPSQGARPVSAKSNGPHDPTTQKPTGIQQGIIYIRAAGPESRRVESSDEWANLLDQCLALKADLVASIIRRSMSRPGRASTRSTDLVVAAVDDTATDYAAQAVELAKVLRGADAVRVRRNSIAFCAMGYALIGEDGELAEIDDPRGIAERASIGMHEYANKGWSLFHVARVTERAPQRRQAMLLKAEQPYLEGTRLPSIAVLGAMVEYWRLYQVGIAAAAVNYEEDVNVIGGGLPQRYLTTMHLIFRLHGLLAHARLVGQQVPAVQQVLVRLDCGDLSGRPLLSSPYDRFCDGMPVDPRFLKTVALPWIDIRDRYFEVLRQLIIIIFGAFSSGTASLINTRITRAFVDRELERFGYPNLRVFVD